MMPEMDGPRDHPGDLQGGALHQPPDHRAHRQGVEGDRARSASRPCLSDYITKPVEPEQLLSLLRVWRWPDPASGMEPQAGQRGPRPPGPPVGAIVPEVVDYLLLEPDEGHDMDGARYPRRCGRRRTFSASRLTSSSTLPHPHYGFDFRNCTRAPRRDGDCGIRCAPRSRPPFHHCRAARPGPA